VGCFTTISDVASLIYSFIPLNVDSFFLGHLDIWVVGALLFNGHNGFRQKLVHVKVLNLGIQVVIPVILVECIPLQFGLSRRPGVKITPLETCIFWLSFCPTWSAATRGIK